MPRKIKAPPEFGRFVRTFFPEGRDLPKNDFEPNQDPFGLKFQRKLIALTLEPLSGAEKQIIKEFLAHLLAQNPSEEQLQKLWNSSGSHYFLVGKRGYEAMRAFLTEVRNQIS